MGRNLRFQLQVTEHLTILKPLEHLLFTAQKSLEVDNLDFFRISVMQSHQGSFYLPALPQNDIHGHVFTTHSQQKERGRKNLASLLRSKTPYLEPPHPPLI